MKTKLTNIVRKRKERKKRKNRASQAERARDASWPCWPLNRTLDALAPDTLTQPRKEECSWLSSASQVCFPSFPEGGPLGSPSEACGHRENQTLSVRRVTGSALPGRGVAPAAAGEREELSIVSNYGLETFWSQKEDSLESFLLWVVNTT